MKLKIKYFFILFCFIGKISFSHTIDELIVIVKTAKPDTNKIILMNELVRKLTNKGEYDKALGYALESVSLCKKLSFKKEEANVFNQIGIIYYSQANYPMALAKWLAALKIYEDLAETGLSSEGAAACNINIGNVYFSQSDFSKALDYYHKGLKIYEEKSTSTDGYSASVGKRNSAGAYINIGSVYIELKDQVNALKYFSKALVNYSEINDERGIAICFGNIGEIYKDREEHEKALSYFLKTLQLSEKIGDKQDAAISCINIGSICSKQADYKEAVKNYLKGLNIVIEIGDQESERSCYEGLAEVYSKTGKYKEAYEYHVKFKLLTDSIFNSDNSKQLSDLKTNFEVEKKEAELKVKSEAEKEKLRAVAEEEKKRQQTVIWFTVCGLLLVLIFAGFILRSLRNTQNQKKIIEDQKIKVDEAFEKLHEKNKEVLDSIRYAKRIQTALLTNEKYIERNFKSA